MQAPRASGRSILWRSWSCDHLLLILLLLMIDLCLYHHYLYLYFNFLLLCFNIRCCSCCCWLIRLHIFLLRSFASGSVKSAFIRCLVVSIDTLMFIAIVIANSILIDSTALTLSCVDIVIVIVIVIVVELCLCTLLSCWL